MKNKNGFTLIEIAISVTLLSVVMVFMIRFLSVIRKDEDGIPNCEDVAGKNFTQLIYHKLIKAYSKDTDIWGISIAGYNSDGKINDVKFYLK